MRVEAAPFFDRDLGSALLRTVEDLGGWAEHGVVEHRFAETNGRWYAELVERYNHTANPGRRLHTHTSSRHIARALGSIRDQGLVQRRTVEATGHWSFDGTISAWAPATVPPSDMTLSWAAYARGLGIDSDTWPLDDLVA